VKPVQPSADEVSVPLCCGVPKTVGAVESVGATSVPRTALRQCRLARRRDVRDVDLLEVREVADLGEGGGERGSG
jgi:hypothetical protein